MEDGTRHLIDQWRAAGVAAGDTLLVHSSLQRTVRSLKKANYDATPHLILQSLLDAIDGEGTLLLPLFNFDFTKGVPFDIRTTPSQMGSLTEVGRLHPDAVRTGHPIYSFAVIGAQSKLFRGVNNFSGYGSDSPFAILRELDGKIAVLDLPDQHSMTFYHHIEEMNEVPYRFHKRFTADYTDRDGRTESRTYGLFVRDLDRGVLTHVDPMGELLWEQGLYHGDRPGVGSGLRTIRARAMFDAVSQVIQSDRAHGLLYRLESDVLS